MSAAGIPRAWAHLRFWQDGWLPLRDRLAETPGWLPGPERVFAALEMTPPEALRVVILGQDPYPTPGHAMGLAFGVAPGVALPRSLGNIYREMRDDLGACPADGDLSGWARQGVLLLNTSLSVAPGAAGSHARLGWEALVAEVLAEAARRPAAWVLWGAAAARHAALADPARDLVVTSAHPSPLSARRGFFGSRPFSRVNAWLEARGAAPIDWVGGQGGT